MESRVVTIVQRARPSVAHTAGLASQPAVVAHRMCYRTLHSPHPPQIRSRLHAAESYKERRDRVRFVCFEIRPDSSLKHHTGCVRTRGCAYPQPFAGARFPALGVPPGSSWVAFIGIGSTFAKARDRRVSPDPLFGSRPAWAGVSLPYGGNAEACHARAAICAPRSSADRVVPRTAALTEVAGLRTVVPS
jgi:hypothetical protein